MDPFSILLGMAIGIVVFVAGYLFGKGVGRTLDKKIDHLLRVKEEEQG